MQGVRFFAQKKSAHKGSRLAGNILLVPAAPKGAQVNGQLVMTLATAKGTDGVPLATWTDEVWLMSHTVEVDEATACSLSPRMFASIEAYERSPEYRASYRAEMVAAVDAGRVKLAPADEGIIAFMANVEHPQGR